MAGLTRKELKTDQVANTVSNVFEWASEHRKEVVRWGGLALVAVIALIGMSYYRSFQAEARQIAVMASCGGVGRLLKFGGLVS